jgi:hypothetical protein
LALWPKEIEVRKDCVTPLSFVFVSGYELTAQLEHPRLRKRAELGLIFVFFTDRLA